MIQKIIAKEEEEEKKMEREKREEQRVKDITTGEVGKYIERKQLEEQNKNEKALNEVEIKMDEKMIKEQENTDMMVENQVTEGTEQNPTIEQVVELEQDSSQTEMTTEPKTEKITDAVSENMEELGVEGETDAEVQVDAEEQPTEPIKETTQPTLPEITTESRVVELVRHENVSLYMQISFNPNTGVSGGCDIYLVDRRTGLPMFDGSRDGLHIKKSRLCSATDEKVLNCILDLEEEFTIDEQKLAFERAKQFLEVSKRRTPIKNSMSFRDAYTELNQYIIEGEAKEQLDNNLQAEQRKFMYDKEAGVVGVRDNYFQHALDDICSGYSQIRFNKNLKEVEAHLGITLEIHNNNRHGWCTTKNGKFLRFYCFKVMDLSALCNAEEE
jgi:hypothetical protein